MKKNEKKQMVWSRFKVEREATMSSLDILIMLG